MEAKCAKEVWNPYRNKNVYVSVRSDDNTAKMSTSESSYNEIDDDDDDFYFNDPDDTEDVPVCGERHF